MAISPIRSPRPAAATSTISLLADPTCNASRRSDRQIDVGGTPRSDQRYAVGIKIGKRADQMTVEAEDALIAALKVKTAHPEAAITYVRKRNARGDARHPHPSQIDEDPAGQAAGDAARSRSSVQTVHGTIKQTMPDPVPKPPG